MNDEVQLERLEAASVKMSAPERETYLAQPDVLPASRTEIPKGYKRCTKCGTVKKIYMFNRNAEAKDGCTSQCKDCQKKTARKSYAKNKHKKTYQKYYQEHKEAKQAQSRQYYQEHKEELKVKHAQYRQTKAGKRAMTKAHAKRNQSLKDNVGIPYTREIVIDRDRQGGPDPICYLCGEPITGTQMIHLDHVVPVVMGGRDCFTNVACVHDTCNLRKSKDAREVTVEQVAFLEKLSDSYMEAHQDLFPDIFGTEQDIDEDATEIDE